MTADGEGGSATGVAGEIAAYLKGERSAEELLRSLDCADDRLSALRSEFRAAAGEFPQELLCRIPEAGAYAECAFDNYGAAVAGARGALLAAYREGLMQAAQHTSHAALCLDRALAGFREAAFRAMGPTDIANVNLMHLMAWRVRQEGFAEEPCAVLARLIAAERLLKEKTLAQLAGLPPSEEADELREAFRGLEEGLASLEDGLSSRSLPQVEQGSAVFLEKSISVKNHLPAVRYGLFSGAPTSSPPVNLVINYAEVLRIDPAGNAMFEDALGALVQMVETVKGEMSLLAGSPSASALEREESERAGEAVGAMEEALELYCRFLETREEHLLEAASRAVAAPVERLQQAFAYFEKRRKQAGMTLCMRCQHHNMPGRKICERCAAPLVVPVLMGSMGSMGCTEWTEDGAVLEGGADSSTVRTDHMQLLFDAAEKVQRGEMELAEFSGKIAWMENLITTSISAAHAVLDNGRARSGGGEREEGEAFLAGIISEYREGGELMLRGLAEYRSYIEHGDPVDILRGSALVQEGGRRAYEAQQELHARLRSMK